MKRPLLENGPLVIGYLFVSAAAAVGLTVLLSPFLPWSAGDPGFGHVMGSLWLCGIVFPTTFVAAFGVRRGLASALFFWAAGAAWIAFTIRIGSNWASHLLLVLFVMHFMWAWYHDHRHSRITPDSQRKPGAPS
jgi:hypothetical protein